MSQGTSYQVSMPAVHAARVILRNFKVTELGEVEATEENIATIIDVGTQTFRLLPKLQAVVTAAKWASSDDLQENMDRLQAAVEAIKPVAAKVPRYADAAPAGNGYTPPAAAVHTAHMLTGQFMFTRRSKVEATEKNIAIMVDVCTSIGRVMDAVNSLASYTLVPKSQEFAERMNLVRKALRAVELVRNYLPDTGIAPRVTLRERSKVEVQLTKQQLRETNELARKVSSARTVDEQVRLLLQAGYVKV